MNIKKIITMLMGILFSLAIVQGYSKMDVYASTFVPRTTEPSTTNKYYIHTSKGGLNECILITGDSCLPNCVGYAWGRAYEILGSRPNLSKDDADKWYNYNKTIGAYSYGNTPKIGAIMCWGSCHVAVVESINGDNMTISESSYGGFRFRTKTGKISDIQNYLSGFQGYIYLPVSDTSQPTTPTGSRTITDGDYHIVTALDNSYGLNVAYNSKDCGANIQLHNNMEDGNFTSVVTVKHLGDGYYKLTMRNSGRVLDVQNASTSNGANVWQYDDNGSDAQQWIIQDAGDGYFFIISKHSGLYMEVAGGYLCDYANIQMYTGNKSTAQKWKFIAWGAVDGQTIENGDYHIISAVDHSYSIDVYGSSLDDGANIYLYQTTKNNNQIFTVTYLGNGFYKLICKHSGKAINVEGNGTESGTNVSQCAYNNQLNQQWILKDAGNGYYYIVSKRSGLYLDLSGGAASNGKNVQVYLGNGTNAQKWAFIKERGNKISFDMQGGCVDGAYATYTANGINTSRNQGYLVVYTIPGQTINTNHYGVEAKVDANGKVIQIRGYESDDIMKVPADGCIVSGHYTAGITGYTFTSKLAVGQYVGYDTNTMKVSAYKDVNSYLIENKFVNSGSKYGILPTPRKEGYSFEGWFTSKTGGSIVSQNNTYFTDKLYAHWEKIQNQNSSSSNTSQKTTNNTQVKETNQKNAENAIISQKTDKDLPGSTFSILCVKATKVSKKSVKIQWTKVAGASNYIIYGNRCGSAYQKITVIPGNKNSWTHAGLKKGTYYKYLIMAVKESNGNQTVLSTSKTIHVATGGGKVGNYTAIKLDKKKINLKCKQSVKIKAVAKKGKLKVKNHRKIAFESSNPSIATVSSKGKVVGKKKGNCYIYAYGQNGVFAKVKISVK